MVRVALAIAVLVGSGVVFESPSGGAGSARQRPSWHGAGSSIGITADQGPLGSLDGVVTDRDTAAVRVIGWAGVVDRGGQVRVELSAHGNVFSSVRTGQRRADVTAAYGSRMASPGFDALVILPEGAHTICADAVHPIHKTRVRLGCAPVAPRAAREQHRELDDLIDRLGRRSERALGGVTVAIAVTPFDTGRAAGWRTGRLFISASAAKAWWTAAALANGQADAARDVAGPVFEESSDLAAGVMIDLAGGIDAVNDFTLSIGMNDTAAMKWNKGRSRYSSQFPGRLSGSNHVDASDATRFLYKLGTYQVLAHEDTALLARWMRRSPRDADDSAVASTIPHSLPQRTKRRVEHKSGWLEPGRYSVPPHLLDVGIVRPGDGSPPYAIALMAAGGDAATYERLIGFFQSASCQIFVHMTGDDWQCPRW